MSMVKQSSQEVVEQNPEIPNEQNEAVSNIASQSIIGTIQNLISSGNASDIMSMFSGNNPANESHPVMQNAMSDLSGNLESKLGISGEKASGLAGSIIPMIIGKLFNNSGNGGFDLSSLLGGLSGGQGGGFDFSKITSMLGGSGLDINKDGKTDFKDLTDAIGGGGRSNEGNNSSDKDGGILDQLSGLFGK